MLSNELFNLSSYQYDLPEELIAKFPSDKRDASRMMVLGKDGAIKSHRHFFDLTEYLNEGDLLVLNDTKVLNARFFGVRETGGKVEIFFLKPLAENQWEILTKCGSKLKLNEKIYFLGQPILEIIEYLESGVRICKWLLSENIYQFLEKNGEPPLPPYIVKSRGENEKNTEINKEFDQSRYQTVYAKEYGAVAAPTAGLHFTQELLEKLKAKGVKIATILLHVGYGTFSPIKEDDIRKHQMHFEQYELTKDVADQINATKEAGKKVLAVGTTSGRTLETCASIPNKVSPGKGETNIFIYPGYQFKIIDGIITNFHLPKSTLIVFISALVGKDQLLAAYQKAIELNYRFYSYGDGMLIL
jgi:S-adenosylmethionine:tRNA ribosyltransferase-isomerase